MREIHPPAHLAEELQPAGELARTPLWYALRTRPRHEKRVASLLKARQVEAFLPLLPCVHQWSDRRKRLELPLFAGYVFVRLSSARCQRLGVLQTPGVTSLVAAAGRPLPIPDKQIEDVRRALNLHVPAWPHPYFRAGQRVRIRGGCLDGVEGLLLGNNGSRSLLISIPTIAQSLKISIAGYDVEPL